MENEMRYKQGDILVEKGNFYSCKVLGICGEVYLMSHKGAHDRYNTGFTQKDLDGLGYKLKTEPKIKELILEDVAKKELILEDVAKLVGTDVKNIKIVEG